MAKLGSVTVRLLGTFAMEADVGRVIPISIRGRKPQALLAYLAMQPDYQARREQLATLFWGDNPDMLARHSLRQCLNSLRQDLCAASEILIVDREAVRLSRELVRVDARMLLSLAVSGRPEHLAEAAALWRGSFLADLALDIEEFDAWRNREADRLAAAAAGVFETVCRNAEAKRDGGGALAAAERLVALDPTREDWQRLALQLVARHKGREAALSRAKALVELLRDELDVAPESGTRALIEQIKRGEFEPSTPREVEMPAPPIVVQPVSTIQTQSIAATLSGDARADLERQVLAAATVDVGVPPEQPFWRRVRPAVAFASLAVVAVVVAGALTFANGSKPTRLVAVPQHNQGVVVLPFGVDNADRSDDAAFARALTHGMIGYLTRFVGLRVIAEPTAEFYRDRPFDPSLVGDLGVRYAVIGHVSSTDGGRSIDLQLVDTTSRANVWSDKLQRGRDDAAVDDLARGMARMVAIEISNLATMQTRDKPREQLTTGQLIARGYWALQRGHTRANLNAALGWFNEVLRREPHHEGALLAVARVHVMATMNFIDLDPPPDLAATERLLNDILRKYPNSITALYSMAMLQKYERQYDMSMQLLQRCLEINPSFLPAQGQMGDILVRLGQPDKGLEQILQTIRGAAANDPTNGFWYLFAAEAELELGHDRQALEWALRADAFMPGSPLVQAWLASIYTALGDKPNAAKYVAALTKAAPERTRAFLDRPPVERSSGDPRNGLRLFQGLRLALSGSPG